MTPSPSYSIVANWNARRESPESLAARSIAALERLRALDPVFSNWHGLKSGKFAVAPLGLDNASVADWIANGVSRSPDGRPEPVYGYLSSAFNCSESKWIARGIRFGLSAGSDLMSRRNNCMLDTATGMAPDPSIVTFEVFCGALLALAEPFEASVAYGRPNALSALHTAKDTSPRLPTAWLSYLAPRFADMVSPPATAIVERRPDGGLLMAATDETFKVDDPKHMAIARDIAAAVAPFNALPWPQEEALIA